MPELERPPSRHRRLLIATAVGLLASGAVLWVLGYLELGARNGDRLADIGAGILTGGVVSLAFWFIDKAADDREGARWKQANDHHGELLGKLDGLILRRYPAASDSTAGATANGVDVSPTTRADS